MRSRRRHMSFCGAIGGCGGIMRVVVKNVAPADMSTPEPVAYPTEMAGVSRGLAEGH